MSRFISLYSQCRHSVSLATNNVSLAGVHHVPVRYSSLSAAIHRGLARDNYDAKRHRAPKYGRGVLDTRAAQTGRPEKKPGPRTRGHLDWQPPQFTIRKGKKDITDKGPRRKSRRRRFNDHSESFGKQSLVYQVKHGGLRNMLESLSPEKPAAPDSEESFVQKFTDAFGDQPSRGKSRKKGGSPEGENSLKRTWDRQGSASRGKGPRAPWDHRGSKSGASSRARVGMSGGMRVEAKAEPRAVAPYERLPIPIHHTTAASQFLYGRSVVEAALTNSRRQLYRLYMYAGEDRVDLEADAGLRRLAKRKNVRYIMVQNKEGLRMMDKMAGGRPHNGCVLEVSPLPQLPIKSLGPLSDDAARPGFSLEVAHQSAEQEAINGTNKFVDYSPSRPGRKPFVLFLDGIVDPGNLGAILRSATFLGVTSVAIGQHGSSGLTPVSIKASAGASEVLPLYSVSSSLDFLQRSKDAGWVVYASVAAAPRRSRGNSHLTIDRVEAYDPLSDSPVILVIGNEGEGLGRQVRRIADFEISVPGNPEVLGVVDSLNVSVATALMCASFLKKGQGFEIEDNMDEIRAKESDGTSLW